MPVLEDTISDVDSDDDSVEDVHTNNDESTRSPTPSTRDTTSIETEEQNNENTEVQTENEESNVIIDEVNLNESHPVARQQNSEFLDDFYDSIFDYDDNETLHENS